MGGGAWQGPWEFRLAGTEISARHIEGTPSFQVLTLGRGFFHFFSSMTPAREAERRPARTKYCAMNCVCRQEGLFYIVLKTIWERNINRKTCLEAPSLRHKRKPLQIQPLRWRSNLMCFCFLINDVIKRSKWRWRTHTGRVDVFLLEVSGKVWKQFICSVRFPSPLMA